MVRLLHQELSCALRGTLTHVPGDSRGVGLGGPDGDVEQDGGAGRERGVHGLELHLKANLQSVAWNSTLNEEIFWRFPNK